MRDCNGYWADGGGSLYHGALVSRCARLTDLFETAVCVSGDNTLCCYKNSYLGIFDSLHRGELSMEDHSWQPVPKHSVLSNAATLKPK